MIFLMFFMLQQLDGSGDVLEIRMPGVIIPHNDTYYHLQYELKGTIFITGYKANVDSDTVQNVLLYGCGGSTRETKVWIGGAPCEEDPQILWSWANDAPEFNMPSNVSMVAGNKYIKFIVLEIHYQIAKPNNNNDTSGVNIHFTTKPTTYEAGIYLFMAYRGSFPPRKRGLRIDLACNYTSPQINVFAYRTHAHNYATLITGYRERNNTWNVMGSRDPRLPEMFVRTDHVITIRPQDKLYARCEYDTMSSNETIVIGNTHHDEMCNLYLMYYTDSLHIRDVTETCTTQQEFSFPTNKAATWYSALIKDGKSLSLVVAVILLLFVGGPVLVCLKNYCCLHRGYKRPNDGFEKLFGPDDEEEDEILYKSGRDY